MESTISVIEDLLALHSRRNASLYIIRGAMKISPLTQHLFSVCGCLQKSRNQAGFKTAENSSFSFKANAFLLTVLGS